MLEEWNCVYIRLLAWMVASHDAVPTASNLFPWRMNDFWFVNRCRKIQSIRFVATDFLLKVLNRQNIEVFEHGNTFWNTFVSTDSVGLYLLWLIPIDSSSKLDMIRCHERSTWINNIYYLQWMGNSRATFCVSSRLMTTNQQKHYTSFFESFLAQYILAYHTLWMRIYHRLCPPVKKKSSLFQLYLLHSTSNNSEYGSMNKLISVSTIRFGGMEIFL